MRKILPFLDVFSLVGLLAYNLAMFLGILQFGREMGDLGYYSILVIGTVIVLILVFLKYWGKIKQGGATITLLALSLLLFIAYYSSFGRGPDFPWNGRLFG